MKIKIITDHVEIALLTGQIAKQFMDLIKPISTEWFVDINQKYVIYKINKGTSFKIGNSCTIPIEIESFAHVEGQK